MRPTTTSYAAQPASYQFKPINPPTQATQRLLVASKNTPTPAPPVNGGSSVRQVSAPSQQYWNSSASNAQPWVAGNTAPAYGGGGAYGGGAAYGPASYGPGAAAPVAEGGDVGGGECCGNDTCGGDACGGCCCLSKCCCLFKCGCICSTGDLVQHMPFFGTTHGYYYFRPYHVMHVFSQQELATRWGGDARNPYDNTMFQKIYEQMGVAATLPASTVAPVTTVPDYMVPGAPHVVPTPVPSTTPMPSNVPAPQYIPAPQYVPGQSVVPMPGTPGAPVPGAQPGVEYLPPR
jgi:hypothetical protein